MPDDKVPTIGVSKSVKEIKLDGKEYDVIPPVVVAASKILQDMHVKLGKPDTPFSAQGARMVKIIIAVWEDLYPLQSKMWYEDRREYQTNELDIKEQVHQHTGRSLASFPLPVYNMFKKFFPKVNVGERKTCIRLVKQWPIFRMANKI